MQCNTIQQCNAIRKLEYSIDDKSPRTGSGLSVGQNRAVEPLEQIQCDGQLGPTLDVRLFLGRIPVQHRIELEPAFFGTRWLDLEDFRFRRDLDGPASYRRRKAREAIDDLFAPVGEFVLGEGTDTGDDPNVARRIGGGFWSAHD
jgi:hypothetical protein